MTQELFEEEKKYPEGFSYWSDFISKEEEETILDYCSKLPMRPFEMYGRTSKREDINFGMRWNSLNNTLYVELPIPEFFYPLINQVAKKVHVKSEEIVELAVQRYTEGASINWHRDVPPFDKIFGLSLLSDCIFKMKPYKKEDQTRQNTIKITAQRRSFYEISGIARYDWMHSIPPVKHLRYSITMRTLNPLYKKEYQSIKLITTELHFS